MADWPDDGGKDSSLFEVSSAATAQSSTVTVSFKNAPDFENPADDEGATTVNGVEEDNPGDNVYHLRVTSDHNLHDLGTEGNDTGCNGSAVDLKIRVKDVSPPIAPPESVGLIPFRRRQPSSTSRGHLPTASTKAAPRSPFPMPTSKPASTNINTAGDPLNPGPPPPRPHPRRHHSPALTALATSFASARSTPREQEIGPRSPSVRSKTSPRPSPPPTMSPAPSTTSSPTENRPWSSSATSQGMTLTAMT